MLNFSVQLSSIEDVKRFVGMAAQQPFDVDVISGRYVIDAKSIMGLFSIDLSKPIKIEARGTDEENESFRSLASRYVVTTDE